MADKLTKNERRTQAREQARRRQEERLRREKLRRWLVGGGIVVGAIATLLIIALVIVNSIRPASPGPENMASDGIVISGPSFAAERTAATAPEAEPTATAPRSDILQIRIYQDFMCPACKAFEDTNRATIEQLVSSGAATVEVHPIAILDRASLGSKYSSRSASAAACVAQYAPDSFWAFNRAMFDSAPAEQSAGLTNEKMAEIAKGVGIDTAGELGSCIQQGRFTKWVDTATMRASTSIPNTAEPMSVKSTPTVVVNGQLYQGSVGDGASFQAFLTSVAGQLTQTPAGSAPASTPAP